MHVCRLTHGMDMYTYVHLQKQKKQYLGGRGSGQVKAGKGFRTAGFERLRQQNIRGVLISCDVRSEGLCVRESMMAVREHCSRRYPDLFKEDEEEDEKKESAAAVTNVGAIVCSSVVLYYHMNTTCRAFLQAVCIMNVFIICIYM